MPIYIYMYIIIEQIPQGLNLHIFCITWIDHSGYILYTSLLYAIPFLSLYLDLSLSWVSLFDCELPLANFLLHLTAPTLYIPLQFPISPLHWGSVILTLCISFYFCKIYISLIWYINQNLIIYIFNTLRFKSDPWCCHCYAHRHFLT